MMSALFSIVIPVFNAAERLEQCLKSVLAQSFGGWQAVLVDDGSDDGSAQICDSFAAEDSRIRAIHTENRGVSAARNTGIEVSEGEYVIFLDSDDMLLPGALQQLSSKCGGLRENLPENLPDMIIYDFLKISDNAGNAINSDSFSSDGLSSSLSAHEQFPPEGRVSPQKALAWLFEDRYCWNVWQAAFRRSLLESMNDSNDSQSVVKPCLQSKSRHFERCSSVFDENIRVAEDLLMFVRALTAADRRAGQQKSGSVVFLSKPLYAYVSAPESVMNKTLTDSAKQIEAARDVIEVESRLEKIMAENPGEAAEKYHFHAFHIFFSWAVRICATAPAKSPAGSPAQSSAQSLSKSPAQPSAGLPADSSDSQLSGGGKNTSEQTAKNTAAELKRLALRACPPFGQLNRRDKIKYFVFLSGLYKIRTVSAVFNRRNLER
ncbi:MAG: glycosyltransferase [Bifidobacteriaceae bacterium]|nr:glycosyltransferase [Bifidobacteriaceae bacterium]